MNSRNSREGSLDVEAMVVIVIMAAMGAIGALALICIFTGVSMAQMGAWACVQMLAGLFGVLLSILLFSYTK